MTALIIITFKLSEERNSAMRSSEDHPNMKMETDKDSSARTDSQDLGIVKVEEQKQDDVEINRLFAG